MCGNTGNLIFFIFFVTSFVIFPLSAESTLQLLHVLFRHGDRTPDVRTAYPKDPYINETYCPYGPGELTLEGKRKELKLGKTLRNRYGEFLGSFYTPDILEAWSSNTNRTKMSLELVLAGLFPPTKEEMLEPGLTWQPIPFNAFTTDEEPLFFGFVCTNVKKYLAEYWKTPQIKKKMEPYVDIFEYISNYTGLSINNLMDVSMLYTRLTAQKEYALVLPEWTEKVYPKPLIDFASENFQLVTSTTEMRKVTSGTLLKRIVDSSKIKVNDLEPLSKRKIYLYSGHEFNIAHLLNTLEIFEPHVPPYGAYIIFEMHKINGTYGFKIYYQNYSSVLPKLMKLPACDEFCPLDQFISFVAEYFPEKDPCQIKE